MDRTPMTNRRKAKKNIAHLDKLQRVARHANVDALRQLVHAVHRVRGFREMNAAEDPETQAAWDHLQVAVLKAGQILRNPLDKTRR